MIKKKRKFVAITTLIDKDIVISGDTSYTGGIRIDGKIIRPSANYTGNENLKWTPLSKRK